jgi:hypothetical protein
MATSLPAVPARGDVGGELPMEAVREMGLIDKETRRPTLDTLRDASPATSLSSAMDMLPVPDGRLWWCRNRGFFPPKDAQQRAIGPVGQHCGAET